jgi:hypothetical protein
VTNRAWTPSGRETPTSTPRQDGRMRLSERADDVPARLHEYGERQTWQLTDANAPMLCAMTAPVSLEPLPLGAVFLDLEIADDGLRLGAMLSEDQPWVFGPEHLHQVTLVIPRACLSRVSRRRRWTSSTASTPT